MCTSIYCVNQNTVSTLAHTLVQLSLVNMLRLLHSPQFYIDLQFFLSSLGSLCLSAILHEVD